MKHNLTSLFDGSATRKTWWMMTLLTAVIEALLFFVAPHSVLLSALGAAAALPWLAVSAKRMHGTGNSPEFCLFSFGGMLALLLILPLLSEQTLALAQPFLLLLSLTCGIVALSYAIICGFITDSH